MKKKMTVAAAIFLLFTLSLLPTAAATLTGVKTQFSYNVSNPAWLKSLDIKEDMTSTQGALNSAVLVAKPDYPYSKTPEGFRTEVNYYCELYSLDQNSQKAAYLYVLQYVNQFATEATRNVSDEFIMEYLTDAGIEYPAGGLGDYENLIFARALYTLMSTGAVNVKVTPGTTVQMALLQSMTTVFNINPITLAQWSSSSVETIDQYVMVACKIALNTNGFTVNRNTTDEEVYRLTAIMMIRQLGISVNAETADFDEIKLKYLTALLGQQYDISLDPNRMKSALASNEVPFYLLQVMGQSANITIRSSMSYSDAFTAVASNTSYFALESGEFYADIYKYEVHLNYKRSRIWIAPTAYRTSTATDTIMLQIGDKSTASGNYLECTLSESLNVQDIPITVTYQNQSQTVSKTYTVTVYQGASAAPGASEGNSLLGNGNSLIGIASNGMVNTLANSFYAVSTNLPPRVTNIIALMVPDINTPENNTQGSVGQPGAPDYLSQLMYSASGGISAAAPTTPGGTGSLSPNAVGNGNTPSAGIPSSNTIVNRALSVYTGTAPNSDPVLLTQAGEPPEGFAYLTDSNGYVSGIIAVKRHVGADNIEKNSFDFELIKDKLIPVLVAMSVAALAIIILLATKQKRKQRINKQI